MRTFSWLHHPTLPRWRPLTLTSRSWLSRSIDCYCRWEKEVKLNTYWTASFKPSLGHHEAKKIRIATASKKKFKLKENWKKSFLFCFLSAFLCALLCVISRCTTVGPAATAAWTETTIWWTWPLLARVWKTAKRARCEKPRRKSVAKPDLWVNNTVAV